MVKVNKNLVVSVGRCSKCGHLIKNGATYMGKVYGMDCFNEVASTFIKLRDMCKTVEEMNKLADRYGVESI